MSNTFAYRIHHRELFRESTQRWRERKRAADPDYTRANQAAFRAARPNYHVEWRARRKLTTAWSKWTHQLAASRAGRETP